MVSVRSNVPRENRQTNLRMVRYRVRRTLSEMADPPKVMTKQCRYAEAWRTHGDEATQIIEQYRPAFSKIVRRWSNGSDVEFDDMFSDCVVWRMPRFLVNYNPDKSKTKRITYLFGLVNWWCCKWQQRQKSASVIKTEPIAADILTHEYDQTNKLDARDLLRAIDPYDARLLYERAKGKHFHELADERGLSTSVCRAQYESALQNARNAARAVGQTRQRSEQPTGHYAEIKRKQSEFKRCQTVYKRAKDVADSLRCEKRKRITRLKKVIRTGPDRQRMLFNL